MKYVIIEIDHGDDLIREVPVIFSDHLVHSDMSSAVVKSIMENNKNVVRCRPVSAGFINSIEMAVDTHGHSDSLNLKSRPEDSQLIAMHDYLHGLI